MALVISLPQSFSIHRQSISSLYSVAVKIKTVLGNDMYYYHPSNLIKAWVLTLPLLYFPS
jgi:hypothetical protein